MNYNYYDVYDKVLFLLNKHFNINVEINKDSDFLDDIGFDSLDVVEFILIIEDHFCVVIDDWYVDSNVRTFGDAVNYIFSLLKNEK